MSKEVTLTIWEQKRLRLLNEVQSPKMPVVRAAPSMGLSERPVYRLPCPENVEPHATAAAASVDPAPSGWHRFIDVNTATHASRGSHSNLHH